MTHKRREMGKVASDLVGVFRSCVDGKVDWPLTIFGRQGCGKTCAALALLDYTTNGEYWTLARMAESLTLCRSGAYSRLVKTGEEITVTATYTILKFWDQVIQKPDLVVVDELALRSRASDHMYETLKETLDVREGRPLILLTNIDPNSSGFDEIYDARITSRMRSGTMFHHQGKDLRGAK